jgi:hypothetical protein
LSLINLLQRGLILFNFVYYSKNGPRKRGFLVSRLFINPNLRKKLTISVLDLARILATISPSFGATCTPDALLTACDWSLPYTTSKVKDTNTLLALRTFANLFTTPTGRKNVTGMGMGMKVDEWLSALRKGRSWDEVGGRKLPFVTIALKYVLFFFSFSLVLLPSPGVFFHLAGNENEGKIGDRKESKSIDC